MIRSRTLALATTAALALAAAGCSSDQGQATADATTPTSAPAPTAGSSSAATAATTSGPSASSATTGSAPAAGAGCATGSNTVPAGGAQREVADVDGDGKPDTAWIVVEPSGATRAGVVTAAGGGFERQFQSASPVSRSILAIDLNADTPPLILASDGRLVQLWAVIDCTVVDVLNQSGDPYVFSLGFGEVGTGVGCATVDGRRELVGLDTGEPQGDTVPWTSTVVTVSGNQARNGAVTSGDYTRGPDDAAIERLHGVSCDDLQPLTAPEG